MPNRKRKIDPDEESGAKLRLFVDPSEPAAPQRFASRSRISLR